LVKKIITTIAILFIVVLLGALLPFLIQNVSEENLDKIIFPKITPIPKDFPKDKTSNIVFTTDKKYQEYTKVALKSATINKAKDTYYNIYVLCVDLSKKEIKEFLKFSSEKVRINTVSLNLKMLDNVVRKRINFFYVSRADLFKFFIPEIFKDFDKILYLDSDILVLGDLTKLYQTKLEDKYLAAVKRYNFVGIRKKDDYNCGVIVFNLKKCREDKITKKLIKTKNTNDDGRSSQYSYNNTISVKNIKLISPIYNNNATSTQEDFEKFDFKNAYSPFLNNINSLEELDKNTIIAHFIGPDKPWFKISNTRFKKEWWKYAKMVNSNLKEQKRTILGKINYACAMHITYTEVPA